VLSQSGTLEAMLATPATKLTGSDQKVLATLNVTGEISNPTLKASYGWTLVGAQRRKLNTAGLVASRKHGRYFVHTPTGTPATDNHTTTPARPATTTDQVQAAVRSLQGARSRWVGLARLRAKLAEAASLTRDGQDTVLKEMFRAGQLDIIPEDNRKALTDADHAAAIVIGGEAKHSVRLVDES
jgi:hypothetical protein